MSVTVVIDGREAMPIRAIPFVTGWMVSPDVVAKTFSKTDHWVTRLENVVAYYLAGNGKYSPMLPKEWDGILAELQILSEKLKSTETFEQESYPAWREQSIPLLPANCFVWRDEFEEAFRRSYSPTRYTLMDERPGDRDLNFSPRIPEELVLALMQGFSQYQVINEPEISPKLNPTAATSMSEHFESLADALEEWFDQPVEGLPDKQRRRVVKDFFPMPWDHLSPDQRRSVVAQWDYQNDPAMESDRQFWFDFYARKDKLNEQIEVWSAIATPTATDLAQKEARLAELQHELAIMEQCERKASGESQKSHRPIASAGQIMQHFVVIKSSEDASDEWWRERMRFAGRYGLDECRHSKGTPGKRGSSIWYPAEVSGWLVDKGHMTAKAVAGVLRRHFPECSDTADILDPPGG